MNPETLAVVALILAAIPAVLTLVNLFVFRPLPEAPEAIEAVSVLIPARNEEANIAAAIESVLASEAVELELIVLDDSSTDRTAALVEDAARRDPRVRLEHAPPLPEGWCGKQHACHVLSGHARHELLVFLDADVRLAPDALRRMVALMQGRRAPALASGFPRQVTGTFSERLLLPLIHFVLLGYLPMPMMKWTRLPAFSAGCGQLFIARKDAYRTAGGHAAIRSSLHDGVKLPRLFRKAGFSTGLFDATDLASVRMYRTNAEVWDGLGKNATEGIAAPGTIVPMTALLFGGQVLPFLLIAVEPGIALWACLLAWLPRAIGCVKFRQSLLGAVLHPVGVCALLWIQWRAFFRRLYGRPAQWKGRGYDARAA